jgi:MFS family permease
MTLTIFSFGAILIIIFDHAESVGFTGKEKSIFFTINVFTSLGIRFFAGKLSDRIGRRPVMMIGTSAAIIGLAILSMAKTQTEFFIGSVFYGMASGFNSPTLFAWAIDVSDPNRIGRAMSTLFIGVELGVIAGSLCAGLIYQNNLDNIPTIHITSLICSSSALLLLVLARSRKTT